MNRAPGASLGRLGRFASSRRSVPGWAVLLAALACSAGSSRARVPTDPPGNAAGVPAPSIAVPNDPVVIGLSQAHGLLNLGRLPEALQRLEELNRTYPDDPRVIAVYGSALESNGRRDEAVALYRRGVDHLKDPTMCFMALERAYREQQDWADAAQVCLEYLERMGDDNGWVADEFESLIRSDHVAEPAVRALEEASRRRPEEGRLQDLLVLALLFQGKPDRAIDQAFDIDHRRKADGRVLMKVCRAAEEKQFYPAAVDGYARISKLNPDDALESEALFRRATVLRRIGRLDEALAGFDAAAAAAPHGRFAARAPLVKADILDHELHRPGDALVAYRQVLHAVSAAPSPAEPQLRDEVSLAMADCQLRLGKPDEASRLYGAVADSGSDPATRAAALFQVGEMLFYQGRLKEAQDTWYKLTDNYPTQDCVTDALARILLLGEKSDAGGVPVTALAQAEYHRRLGEIDTSFKLIDDALSQFPDSHADDSLLRERVTLFLDLGKTAEAGVAADTLAARFPKSPLSSRALLEVAGAWSGHPEGNKEAEAIYLKILMRFPDSIEAGPARAALQHLKQGAGLEGPGRPGPASPDHGDLAAPARGGRTASSAPSEERG